MSRDWKPQHEAGAALILAVLDAARRIANTPGHAFAAIFGSPEAELSAAVQMLDGAVEQLKPRPAWRMATWARVAGLGAGTRVRLGGAEAVVESAVIQSWHVDPRSNEYRPQPMEHQVVFTKLVGREGGYRFPTGGQVEIADVEYPDPEESLAQWLAAAGAVLEFQAMQALRDSLGAEEL